MTLAITAVVDITRLICESIVQSVLRDITNYNFYKETFEDRQLNDDIPANQEIVTEAEISKTTDVINPELIADNLNEENETIGDHYDKNKQVDHSNLVKSLKTSNKEIYSLEELRQNVEQNYEEKEVSKCFEFHYEDTQHKIQNKCEETSNVVNENIDHGTTGSVDITSQSNEIINDKPLLDEFSLNDTENEFNQAINCCLGTTGSVDITSKPYEIINDKPLLEEFSLNDTENEFNQTTHCCLGTTGSVDITSKSYEIITEKPLLDEVRLDYIENEFNHTTNCCISQILGSDENVTEFKERFSDEENTVFTNHAKEIVLEQTNMIKNIDENKIVTRDSEENLNNQIPKTQYNEDKTGSLETQEGSKCKMIQHLPSHDLSDEYPDKNSLLEHNQNKSENLNYSYSLNQLVEGILDFSHIPPLLNDLDKIIDETSKLYDSLTETAGLENFDDLASNVSSDGWIKRFLSEEPEFVLKKEDENLSKVEECDCAEGHCCLQTINCDEDEIPPELLSDEQLGSVETGSVSDWLYRVSPAACLLTESSNFSEVTKQDEVYQYHENVNDTIVKAIFIKQWLDDTDTHCSTSPHHYGSGDFVVHEN